MENRYDFSKLDILVVEDSPTQLALLQQSLAHRGATVYSAHNGEEALQLLATTLPKIIISDIEMPLLNGYEFCCRVKENKSTKNIPVILLTNLSDPMDVIRGIECGADNFLTKPCQTDLLFTSIINAIENRRERIDNETATVEVFFNGKIHKIKANHFQITDLLLSTYSSAIEKNKELEQTNKQLSRLHLELQKKNVELTQNIQEKNMLLGMAAHDLRNPLNAIQGYSDILLSKLPKDFDEKVLRMIGTIYRSSKFMLQLVNDLLDISVIDLGKLNLKLSKENIFEVVQNNCLINDSIAEKKNIKVLLHYDADIPSMVCDVSKIEQVLNNLLSNAIKFSNPGSEIHVWLKKIEENKKILLSVTDQGVGIPEEKQDQLFDVLAKTKRAAGTAGEPSHGLGLAIVKRIVEAHRGKIWVESQLGVGSTFFVELPMDLKLEQSAPATSLVGAAKE